MLLIINVSTINVCGHTVVSLKDKDILLDYVSNLATILSKWKPESWKFSSTTNRIVSNCYHAAQGAKVRTATVYATGIFASDRLPK